MINRGFPCIKYFFTQIYQPPAKVYFFLMGKKTLIKSASLPKIALPYKKATARRPENLRFVIILPFILL